MIKRFSYENMQQILSHIDSTYAKQAALGALAALDEVGESNLASALRDVINGKADKATTLAGYGITDGMTATEIASAISTAIAGADHLQRKVVTNVGEINVNAEDADRYIYMVPKAGESGDSYDEYMVISGALESVGDWKVDLSDYAKTAEVTAAIAAALVEYAKTADVTKAINDAVANLITLESLSVETTGTGNVVTAVEYNNSTGKFTVTKGITALQESDIVAYTTEEINGLFTA